MSEEKQEKQQALEEFNNAELLQQFEEEEKERREELGIKDLIKLGLTTDIVVKDSTIKTVDTKHGKRYVFNCGEKNLMASKYLTHEVLKKIDKIPAYIRIVKTGTGVETKYTVVELDKDGNIVEEVKEE